MKARVWKEDKHWAWYINGLPAFAAPLAGLSKTQPMAVNTAINAMKAYRGY